MSEMNAEALALIQQTAQEAQTAKLCEVPGDDTGRTARVQIGGALKTIEVPPPRRQHVVHCLADLVAYAAGEACKCPVIWHGPAAVILICDDTDRRDRVTFPLTHSRQFAILAKLERSPLQGLDHLEWIRLLRLELDVDEAVVGKFRSLDWATTNNSKARLDHTNAELGNDVMARVQGIDELPTTLTLEVPVYEQQGERQKYQVRCNLEIDATNQQLYLKPSPGQSQTILDRAQADIGGRINEQLIEANFESEAPVYYGSPESPAC